MASNHPFTVSVNQMVYWDISNLFYTQGHTGIQRVLRAYCAYADQHHAHTSRWLVYDRQQHTYRQIPWSRVSQGATLGWRWHTRTHAIGDFQVGDVFVDADSAWHENPPRAELLPDLKSCGVTLIWLHYDASPLLFPEFCHPETIKKFTPYFFAQINHADHALCISQEVSKQLIYLSKIHGYPQPNHSVNLLGSDLCPQKKQVFVPFTQALQVTFILYTGTLEPRKDHELLLKAYEQTLKSVTPIHLVFLGKRGWQMDKWIQHLQAHPDFGTRIHWLEHASDDEVAWCYQHAWAVAMPSRYEGFGLPAVEALAHDCVTLVSDAGSLPEVTQGAALVLPVGDVTAWANALLHLWQSPEAYDAAKTQARRFVPRPWADSAADMQAMIAAVASTQEKARAAIPTLTQWVCLSARPDDFAITLVYWQTWLPWIREVIVVCPMAQADAFAKLSSTSVRLMIIHDEALLASIPRDHQTRNHALRQKIVQRPEVAEHFVMADDDARPTMPLTPFVFYLPDGRHRARYFLESSACWCGNAQQPTSFDEGQWRTARYLQQKGYPCRSFAAHVPQIIDKSLFNGISRQVGDDGIGMDEWSLYFNIASTDYPSRFHLEAERAQGWPARPSDWVPESHIRLSPWFENSDAAQSRADGLMAGKPLPPNTHDSHRKKNRYQAWFASGKPVCLAINTSSVDTLKPLYHATGQRWLRVRIQHENHSTCEVVAQFSHGGRTSRQRVLLSGAGHRELTFRLPWHGEATLHIISTTAHHTQHAEAQLTVKMAWPLYRHGRLLWGDTAGTPMQWLTWLIKRIFSPQKPN